ncbi:MAG: energy transducer TonB [Proteobacteria bacterium]|nr:energy transducer TonB [Pseudomonadota bacterium]
MTIALPHRLGALALALCIHAAALLWFAEALPGGAGAASASGGALRISLATMAVEPEVDGAEVVEGTDAEKTARSTTRDVSALPAFQPEPELEPEPLEGEAAEPHAAAPGGAVDLPIGTAGTGPGRGDGSGDGIGSGDAHDYFAALSLQVERGRRYPRRAERRGIEGVAVLALRIDREGRLEWVELAESAGDPSLDRGALDAARAAAPFGSVPDSIADSDLEFELPVEFRLR